MTLAGVKNNGMAKSDKQTNQNVTEIHRGPS